MHRKIDGTVPTEQNTRRQMSMGGFCDGRKANAIGGGMSPLLPRRIRGLAVAQRQTLLKTGLYLGESSIDITCKLMRSRRSAAGIVGNLVIS